MRVKKGIYKHHKGKQYEVLEIAKHSETEEDFVVYKALYGDYGIWIRPLRMFNESVEKDGTFVKRFEYKEDQNLYKRSINPGYCDKQIEKFQNIEDLLKEKYNLN